MSCPHGANSIPTTCSQCLCATPRKVERVGDTILIDQQPLGTLRELNDAREVATIKGSNRPTARYRRSNGKRCKTCGELAHGRKTADGRYIANACAPVVRFSEE